MKKILLFLSFLLMSIGVWGADIQCTLTNANIISGGETSTGYAKYTFTDGCSQTWNAYCIKNKHSNADASYNYIQIKAYTSNTAHYLQVPEKDGYIIKTITMVVSSTQKPHDGGDNSATYYFSSSNNSNMAASWTSTNPIRAVYGNGASYITLNCSSLNLTTGYITASQGTRMWGNITVTYTPITIFPKDTVFWLVNGDTIYKDIVEYNSQIDTVPHISINDYCDDEFIGWVSSTYQGSTQPSGLFTNATKPTITKDTTFYAVFGNYENGNITSFFKTGLNEITTSDVFIIVGKANGIYYAMSNDNGSENAPDAPIISPYNDCILSPHDSILWKLSGNNDDGYIFYSYSDNTKWLYSTNQNNGIRVGTGNAKHFTVNNAGYLTTDETDNRRYVGVYVANPDWRSYTSIHNNIKNNNGTYEDFYFYKGTRTIDEYHTNTDCVRKFNNAQNDSLWTTNGNWTNNKIPTIKYIAQIDTAVIVDTTHAVAKHVIINQNTGNGKIIIQPNKGLEVDSTIVVSKNNSYHPTTPNDLILESSDVGNASLIFNNKNNNQATVQLYSKSTYPEGGTANWQYIGTAMTELSALYNYYGSWIYKWDNGWSVVQNGDNMTAWTGYCITQREATIHETTGILELTDTKVVELTVPANSDMVFANSWTAPIHVSKFADADFTIRPQTVYLFNTGSAPDSSKAGTDAGTHVVIPIRSAPFIGDSLIASQQGFFVTNSSNEDKVIRLKYKDLVRTNDEDDIVAGSLHAPKRTRVSSDKPNVIKIYATASYSDKVVILEREDFSTEFDNGWDGNKSSFGVNAPSIYVINTDGSYDAVSAIPDYEGTVLGFKAGIDTTYNITFDYNGDDVWYLNDIKEQLSVQINSENTYTFESLKIDSEIRFIISQTPLNSGVTTNLDSNNQTKQQKKIIINNNIYIVNNGQMFDILGNIIK